MISDSSPESKQAVVTAVKASAISTALHSRRKDSYFEAMTVNSLSVLSVSLEGFESFASSSDESSSTTCCELTSNCPEDYNIAMHLLLTQLYITYHIFVLPAT